MPFFIFTRFPDVKRKPSRKPCQGDKEPLSFDDLFGEENSTAQATNVG